MRPRVGGAAHTGTPVHSVGLVVGKTPGGGGSVGGHLVAVAAVLARLHLDPRRVVRVRLVQPPSRVLVKIRVVRPLLVAAALARGLEATLRRRVPQVRHGVGLLERLIMVARDRVHSLRLAQVIS